ncbi:NPC intracellular cholesterol transporter 2 homolog a-like [Argiope bruennichi]|uniref:NPC intracellular cholesterol transporter 2 like protein n=1 Tax=Argiope bruennichi TaxID=94029 RepID=A0A8T0F3F3_ARGBR|nr:NPC intracellular cholesterol transporter 2 homolog a-like [Argiope bruennichi]KAF8784825.1 NPC intracellular cholesterol transporter 2 like protein [Argiope bruennichi]
MLSAVILSTILISQAWALKYTDCGTKTGKILSVQITGCEETDVCEFKRGETYKYDVSFESLKDSETLKTVVHGIIGGVALPFPVQNPNACESSDIECPLQTGQTYSYGYEIEVRKSYPALRADVKWELKDDNNEDVVCVLVPVKVV